MGDDQQPDLLEAQVDLVQRPLELGQRARLVHSRSRRARSRRRRRSPTRCSAGTPGQGSGSRSRHRPGSTRSPRPSSRLRRDDWPRIAPDHIARRVDCAHSMASTAEIAKRYFAALAAHDLDAAVALLAAGRRSIASSAQQELVAPDGVRDVLRRAVRGLPGLRARGPRADHLPRPHGGALAGHAARSPGRARFRASRPTAPGSSIEGCDVVTVARRPDRPQRRLPRQRRRSPASSACCRRPARPPRRG